MHAHDDGLNVALPNLVDNRQEGSCPILPPVRLASVFGMVNYSIQDLVGERYIPRELDGSVPFPLLRAFKGL